MPENTPVAAVKVTPVGKAPDIDKVGVGVPVVVTVKEPAAPTAKLAVIALVMLGAIVAGVAL
jgi:hypothetical protein